MKIESMNKELIREGKLK